MEFFLCSAGVLLLLTLAVVPYTVPSFTLIGPYLEISDPNKLSSLLGQTLIIGIIITTVRHSITITAAAVVNCATLTWR